MSASLEKQIAILKRKVERERTARKAAEQQLEDHSRQIYLSNQALQRSLQKSQKRERDLEFLANASTNVSSSQELTELLHTTAELTASFSGAVYACYYISHSDKQRAEQSPLVRFEQDDWRPDAALHSAILSLLPDADVLLDNWYIRDVSEEMTDFEKHCQWLVALNFRLLDDSIGWLVFGLAQDLLDEETLFVLDTAKSHIRAGILKRVDGKKLQLKNRELKKTVLRLEKAQRQLVHSEKMASLGQLAAGVAHEINNPIGFILSNQHIMQDYIQDLEHFFADLTEAVATDRKDIVPWVEGLVQERDVSFLLEDITALVKDNTEGAQKVADIVNSLKTFSHSGDMEFRELDVEDCINKSLKVVSSLLKSQRDVQVTMGPGLPKVQGNPAQLQQVLINLLVNAAQATGVYGNITIVVSGDDESLDIAVTDNGCGMDEHTLSRLFTPFFTTKDVGEGTGLGLSVSHGIIEAHGGDIRVVSEVGKGSTFTIVLPAA